MKILLNEPPAKLLERLYSKTLNRSYKKTTDGINLFQQLSPGTTVQKCPHLKLLLDDLVSLAKTGGSRG